MQHMSKLGLNGDGMVQQLLQRMPEGSKFAVVMVQKPITEPPYDVIILRRDGYPKSSAFGRGAAAGGDQWFTWLTGQLPDALVHIVAPSERMAREFSWQIRTIIDRYFPHTLSEQDNPLTDAVVQIARDH